MQALLPIVPPGATRISDKVSVVRDEEKWTYFCGIQPLLRHAQDDLRTFRMVTAQLVCEGACTQAQIVRTFGVSRNSVKRNVKKYREGGISAFYAPRRVRSGSVLTAPVSARAQQLLDEGRSRTEVAEALGIQRDTLRKAINQGRLREPEALAAEDRGNAARAAAAQALPTDKSTRSEVDAEAAEQMGTACTRPMERVLAALGLLQGAPTRFESCRDVSCGGVLCALPALAENGLFRHLGEALPSVGGYYTTLQVVTLLAQMALCRVRTVEQLQYEAPGEMGKLLGLDRVPEVRCLRRKLARLSADEAPQRWAALLSQDWMQQCPERSGTLYVDGHVRVYHGRQTELPRRYVARQRLCLRGTTDYWVNDVLGQPFFVVERPIDHGLIEALTSDIVPRLLEEVPHQPTEAQLEADPYLCRFVIVFDRAGYSPKLFKQLWTQHRIGCITYHKHPKGEWPEREFRPVETTLPSGEPITMRLAERGTWIGDRRDGLWVREVRKLTESGHQISLISSAYGQGALENAVHLFSRWAQENFFRYMMQHYALDLLSEYETKPIPGTNRPVVNPRWRDLDRQRRSLQAKLTQRQARFAAMTIHPEDEPAKMASFEQRKSELFEQIEQLEHELGQVQQACRKTPKHVQWEQLPKQEQFEQLAPSRKHLMDTVKMVAYRAETAMVAIVRERLARADDARALIRDLFQCDADLVPDSQAGWLHVHVHAMANPRSNRAIVHLIEQLNDAEMAYPGTRMRLRYTLGHAPSPPPPAVENGSI